MEIKVLNSWKSSSIHIVSMPIFFIGFVLLYDPKLSNGIGFKDFFSDRFTMNLILLSVILLACVSVLRVLYSLLCRKCGMRIDRLSYVFWCLMENLIIALFTAIYVSLRCDLPYLPAVLTSLKLFSTILVFPYMIVAMSLLLGDLSHKQYPVEDESLIRFYDSARKLKLVITPSSLLYIKSDENYVNIHYVDSGKIKNFVLRNSMKSMEEMLAGHGLRRCHRSYMLNPVHVKVLRKESDGLIHAEMDFSDSGPIPVSKRYYESLSDLL